jgi:transcriptional regulator of acetoin/glycerol metabolism
VKGIRKVDNDLVVPLLEVLRNILVSRKGNNKEDHLSLISVSGPRGFAIATSMSVGNADGAAASLGMNRTTFLSRMKKFGISAKQYA